MKNEGMQRHLPSGASTRYETLYGTQSENTTKHIKQVNPYNVSVVLPCTTAVTLLDSSKALTSE